LLSSTICLAAQSPTPAFEAADALVHGADSEPRSVSLDLDVSVAIWAPTRSVPNPFLRITHVPGADLTADLYVWWMPPGGIAPSKLTRDPQCRPPSQGVRVCIARIGVSQQIDWGSLLVDIVAARVCSMRLTSAGVGMAFDTGDLDVRMYSTGKSEAYSCNAPRGSARAGAREAARVMDVLEKLANDARTR
jgi:hypothetical protein